MVQGLCMCRFRLSVLLRFTMIGVAVAVSNGSGVGYGAVRLALGEAPHTLNPQRSQTPWESPILSALFDRLVVIGPDGLIQPSLAASWEISADGLIYIFRLRENARFSDGAVITALDAAESFKHIVQEYSHIRQSFRFMGILNAQEIMKGHLRMDILGIRVLDDGRLEIRLEYPHPYFLEILASPVGAVLPAALLADEEAFRKSRGKQLVTSGPYVLRTLDEKSWTLGPNKFFWGHTAFSLPEISFMFYPSAAAALEAYKQGDVDILAYDGSMPQQEQMRTGEVMEVAESLGTHFFVLNENNNRLREDLRIRQSVALLIQKAAILKAHADSKLGPRNSNSLVSTQVPSYKHCDYKSFEDLTAAQKKEAVTGLMTTAGYSKDHLFEMRIIYEDSSLDKEFVDALTASMEEGAFIKPNIEALSPAAFAGELYQGRFDIALVRHKSFLKDPAGFLDIYHSDSLQNYIHDDDVQRDFLMEKAFRAPAAERSSRWRDVECNLLGSEYIFPLYESRQILVSALQVKNPLMTLYGLSDMRFLSPVEKE